MADPPSMIRTFCALPNTAARHSALESLITKLTPYEWRFLQGLLDARQFQLDIIGQLPVELVAHVFSFLNNDPGVVFRLQLVSRRWNQVLRNPHVLRSVLRPWYNSSADPQPVDYAVSVQIARSGHAFLTGRSPNISFKISGYHTTRHTLLVGDSLIWIPGRGPELSRRFCILNLRTGHFWEAQGDGREQILTAEASDQLLAFCTSSNFCYVSNLDGSGRKKFRVANASMFQALTCRGRHVACAGILEEHATVYIWNYDSQQGISFDIAFTFPLFTGRNQSHFRLAGKTALLLHPETETIVVFSGDGCACNVPEHTCGHDQTPPALHYGRFTFRGKYSHGSSISLTGPVDLNFRRPRFTPVSHDGLFSIQLTGCFGLHYDHGMVNLQYDERLDQFTPPPLLEMDYGGQALWTKNKRAWYHDTVYQIDNEYSRGVRLAHLGSRDRPRSKPLELERVASLDRERLSLDVYTNGRYVVMRVPQDNFSKTEFYVLCYDESVVEIPASRSAVYDIERWGNKRS